MTASYAGRDMQSEIRRLALVEKVITAVSGDALSHVIVEPERGACSHLPVSMGPA